MLNSATKLPSVDFLNSESSVEIMKWEKFFKCDWRFNFILMFSPGRSSIDFIVSGSCG